MGYDISQLARLNYRNHRKITVVDAEIGHSGGFNIGQEYIDGGKKYPAWRDTGDPHDRPGVADLEKLFDMRWYEVFGEDLFKAEYYPDSSLPHGEIMVQTVHQGYDDPWNSVTRAYQLAMSGAREHIMLQSPYFVPDQTTLDVLINAAAGGVRVDFMTTAWPDKKMPWWAAESYFEPLLRREGTSGCGRTASSTPRRSPSTASTARSGRSTWTCGVCGSTRSSWSGSTTETIAEQSERLFRDDLRDCRELTLEEVRGWSRARRFRNSSARLMSNLL